MTPIRLLPSRRRRLHRPESISRCDLPDEVLDTVLETAGRRVPACLPAEGLWWIRRA